MALYVKTNVSSMNAQRMLSNSTTALDNSYKRLASGLRINSAKDDAAGLQISNRLTSQLNGLEQGNRNAQDAISFAQTAEGAMDEMTTMYQRIRTLAIQSANGTNSKDDRDALQREVTQLCAEIDRITKDTTFAGERILTGTKSTNNDLGDADVVDNYSRASAQVEFQVGGSADQTISILLGNGTDELGYSVADVAKSIGATEDAAITAAATAYLKTDDTGVSTGLVFNIS